MELKELCVGPSTVFRILAKVFAFGSLFLILISGLLLMTPRLIAGTDFIQLYLGTRMILGGFGHHLYEANSQIIFYKDVLGSEYNLPILYRAFPTLTLPFSFFAFFPIVFSYKIFVLINIILVLIVSRILRSMFKFKDTGFLYLSVFIFWPVITDVLIGQVSLLFLILMLVIFRLLGVRGKSFMVGLLCSLLINRIQLLLFVPFVTILSDNRKDFIKGFLGGIMLIVIVSFCLVGFKQLVNYPSFIINTEVESYGSLPAKYSTIASLFYGLGFSTIYVYAVNFVLYLLALALFWKKHKGLSYQKAFFSAILITLVFAVHTGIYDLVILLIPATMLLKEFLVSGEKIYLIIFSVLFCLPFLDMRYSEFSFIATFPLLYIAFWFLTFKNEKAHIKKGKLSSEAG